MEAPHQSNDMNRSAGALQRRVASSTAMTSTGLAQVTRQAQINELAILRIGTLPVKNTTKAFAKCMSDLGPCWSAHASSFLCSAAYTGHLQHATAAQRQQKQLLQMKQLPTPGVLDDANWRGLEAFLQSAPNLYKSLVVNGAQCRRNVHLSKLQQVPVFYCWCNRQHTCLTALQRAVSLVCIMEQASPH